MGGRGSFTCACVTFFTAHYLQEMAIWTRKEFSQPHSFRNIRKQVRRRGRCRGCFQQRRVSIQRN